MKLDVKKFEILLAEKGMTLTELKKRSGITWSAMRDFSRKLRPVTIGKIAKGLGVSVDEITEE